MQAEWEMAAGAGRILPLSAWEVAMKVEVKRLA